MPDIRGAAALIIAEDGDVRDSLTVLLEAYGLTVKANARIAGYLHQRAAAHDCRVLVTYQTTTALALGVVRQLRDLGVVVPAVLLAPKVELASTVQAEQFGAMIIEAPPEQGAMQRAIEAALQTSETGR